jgi:acyl carrier protein
MNQEQIAAKIEEYIKKSFIFDNSTNPARGESLLETGIIDSTGVLELISYIEETFSITVDDEELTPENLDSIDKITGFIAGKTA